MGAALVRVLQQFDESQFWQRIDALFAKDEIRQLLMGESLYGDPGLCIRELLQTPFLLLALRRVVFDGVWQSHAEFLQETYGVPPYLKPALCCV
jgi:hypothetical protein